MSMLPHLRSPHLRPARRLARATAAPVVPVRDRAATLIDCGVYLDGIRRPGRCEPNVIDEVRLTGEGFVWLQRVVEAITGESLNTTLRRLIFEPLGMHRSSYVWQSAFEANYADPHDARGAAACHFPRVPSLKAFGRRPRCKPHRCDRPASETLNKTG